ncbi:MAG: hypothetical protein WCI73_06650, partial [Phycisphaerae bacterium]
MRRIPTNQPIGETPMTTTATAVAPAPEAPAAPVPTNVPGQHAGTQIALCMWGVDVVVRRPTGRVQLLGSEVAAQNDTGAAEVIDAKKITKPSFKIDQHGDHPMWEQIDLNARLFESILARYSVSDARRGFHLVPQSKMGEMIVEFSKARRERLELATKFRDDWTTFVNNLRLKFNGHFHLLLPKLPNPDSLLEKFDVTWIVTELTPMDPNKFKFNNLNATDQAAIIQESNNMAKSLVAQRAKGIFDEVFGSVIAKCDEIAAGAFESGSRKFGAITELVNVVERLKNFGEFGNSEISAHADATLSLLNNIQDINEVNRNSGQNAVSLAIKAAAAPLAASIKVMMNARQGSRSRRRVE